MCHNTLPKSTTYMQKKKAVVAGCKHAGGPPQAPQGKDICCGIVRYQEKGKQLNYEHIDLQRGDYGHTLSQKYVCDLNDATDTIWIKHNHRQALVGGRRFDLVAEQDTLSPNSSFQTSLHCPNRSAVVR